MREETFCFRQPSGMNTVGKAWRPGQWLVETDSGKAMRSESQNIQVLSYFSDAVIKHHDQRNL